MATQELAKVLTTVAVLYGGGQIPSANLVLGKLMEHLISMNYVVYGIRKSYMGLANESCYERFSIKKAQEIQNQIGTYLEMCRNVNPAEEEWFNRIIKCLETFDIHTLFICGGDGSLRGAIDFEKRAKKSGFEMRIMFIPCTIDGINGSLSIGKSSAVAESIRRVKSMIANAFATWDAGLVGPRTAIIEVQGRNRNDILCGVIKELAKNEYIGRYKFSDINIICIPSGISWSYAKLILSILDTNKPSAIIVAEGAKPQEPWWEAVAGKGVGDKLANLINSSQLQGRPIKKANLDVVGYLSQTNNWVSNEDINEINSWICIAANMFNIFNVSKAIVDLGEGPEAIGLSELKKKNPNSKRPELLSKEELESVKPYLP